MRQELSLAYIDNSNNGGFWSTFIALILSAGALGAWYYIVTTNAEFLEADYPTYGAGGAAACLVFFLIIRWLLLKLFETDAVTGPVTPADEAVVNVNATSMSIFAFASYVIYKIRGKNTA